MAADSAKLELEPRTVAGGHVITPRTHQIDRYRAECIKFFLEPRRAEGGELRYSYGVQTVSPPPRRWERLRKKRPRQQLPTGRCFVEMRRDAPENFAHFLNTHLPTFFRLSEELDIEWSKALLLVPASAPSHVHAVARVFGLETLATDAVVEGDGLTFQASPWTSLRSAWAAWAGASAPQAALERTLREESASEGPQRFFLSRRGSRLLTNAAEIEAALANRGFKTVYAEDHSVAAQMRLFREAEAVVAIHGAGIAPLLYCTPDHRPQSIVELLPAGIMTDVYRDMATQVGVRWIGVQGKLQPHYFPSIYDTTADFTAHAFDDFEVDPASIDLAFEMLELS